MEKVVLSKFSDKPKGKEGWRAMWVGLATLLVGPLLGVNAAFVRPTLDKTLGETVGSIVTLAVALAAVSLPLIASVYVVRIYRRGEHSWAVWLGMVPAILSATMLTVALLGEIFIPH